MENNISDNKWLRPINILFYLVFTAIFNYHFMCSTMLYGKYLSEYFPYFLKIYDNSYWILLVMSVFTIIFLFKDVKTKILPIAILAIALLYNHFRDITSIRSLSTFLMILICSKGKSYKVMGVISLICGWSWIIVSAIACKMGNIPDIVFGNRHSLGSIYMTDLACHFLTLMMVVCILRKGKLKIWEYIISIILMVVNITLMKAKVGFLCLFILMAGTFYYQYILPHSQINTGVKKIYKNVCLFAILVLAPLLIYLTATYSSDPNVLYNKLGVLDTIRSRLMLGRRAMDQYPITMWGMYIPEKGNGGNTTGVVTDYFFLDISYIRVLFKDGIVMFSLVIIMYVKLQRKLVNSKCIYLMFVVLVFLIDSAIEHHIIEIAYSVLPYLLFSNEIVENASIDTKKQAHSFTQMLIHFKSQLNKQT